MSANLVVDLGNTTVSYPSITCSGACFVASGPGTGTYVGVGVDLINADTYCNLQVNGLNYFTSGQLRVQVQTAASDTSGSYTDPTSGFTNFPGAFQSGGILILQSGGTGGGTLGAGVSGQYMASGFDVFQGFQRNARFVRALIVSGTNDFFAGTLVVGFVSNERTTGSGGGFSYSPSSGSVNV